MTVIIEYDAGHSKSADMESEIKDFTRYLADRGVLVRI